MLTWRETVQEPLGCATKTSTCGRYVIAVTRDPLADMENMLASYCGKDRPGNLGVHRYPIGDRPRKENAARELRTACDAHAVSQPSTPETLAPERATTGRFHRS